MDKTLLSQDKIILSIQMDEALDTKSDAKLHRYTYQKWQMAKVRKLRNAMTFLGVFRNATKYYTANIYAVLCTASVLRFPL